MGAANGRKYARPPRPTGFTSHLIATNRASMMSCIATQGPITRFVVQGECTMKGLRT